MKIAALTIVHNERIMLPLWLRYYRRWFNDADIYVIDNDSNDGSTADLGCNIFAAPSIYGFDSQWMRKTVIMHFAFLLERGYDYVLFAECDELIATRGDLAKDIADSKATRIRCEGYEVIHQIGKEPPLDWEKPILAQRSKWYRSRAFSKVAIASVPIHWNVGFHSCGEAVLIDPHFTLVHLHRIDYNTAVMRLSERQGRPISEETKRNHWGWQNLLAAREVKQHWSRWVQPTSSMQPIPEWVRGLI